MLEYFLSVFRSPLVAGKIYFMDSQNTQKIAVVILAAGHGKRMQSEIPKSLTPLHGKPLILHLLERVEASGVGGRPIIVVGQKREQVMEALGDKYTYAVQEEQLGTGHAVMSAKEEIGDADHILVLYADMPYISTETIKNLVEKHIEENATLTMATITVPDFNEWRAGFFDFSRVIRNESGKIIRTVERKDQSEEEQKILEVNPAYMIFDARWMWENMQNISNENSQKEYYLTDLIRIACDEGERIASISIEPKEALGVNTKEQLELIHSI